MVFVRATIVEEAGWHLARSATIAIRYAAVRRQTAPAPGAPETQVLDYQSTAAVLIPLIATSYALIFAGQAAMRAYNEFDAARANNDFSSLPALHASLAGAKAASTWAAADGAEAARRACGGHGYSALSGLPQLFASYVQNVTWEGDNNVMCLQAARFAVKAELAARAKGGGVRGGLAAAAPVAGPGRAAASVVALLRARASSLLADATDALLAAGGGAATFAGPAWNATTGALVAAARAGAEADLAATLDATVEAAAADGRLPPREAGVMRTVARLFALGHAVDGAGDVVSAGAAAPAFARAARAALAADLAALRPAAVALVDAFSLPDYLLDSALGASDGDVYRRLFAGAAPSPLSATPEGAGWAPVLRDLLAPTRRAAARAARAGKAPAARL